VPVEAGEIGLELVEQARRGRRGGQELRFAGSNRAGEACRVR
jgi:hypothetical protein